jgi:hypothetical protein
MMGVIEVAGGAAVQPLPLWIATLIAIGAVAQPLGFLPLAARPDLARNAVFRALAVLVFLATTVGCTSSVRPLRTEV